MSWSDLSAEQQSALYQAWQAGQTPQSLASRSGMKATTLERRLRERRQTNGDKRQMLEMPTMSAGGRMPRAGQTCVVANPTDAHGVYCDPYAWELALKLIEALKPDDITWGNDAVDFGVISNYARISALPTLSEEKRDEQRRRQELGQAAPKAKIWWVAGNHDLERYQRYIWNRAGEMADDPDMQFPNYMKLPGGVLIEAFEAGNTLRVIHGTYVRKQPGASVNLEIFDNPLNRKGRLIRSVMSGHVHRFAHVKYDHGIEGLECGCLQNLRPEYLKEQRRASNWSHGIGAARYGRDWSQIIPLPFFARGGYLCAYLEGKEYRVKITEAYSGF